MKIEYKPSEEDIEKLNQLDRIEYKFDKKEIDEGQFSSIIWISFNVLIPLTILFMLVNWFGIGSPNYEVAITFFKNLLTPIAWVCVGSIVIDFILIIINGYEIKELNQKYFRKEETNGRRK